jgi:SAM-dependent MidA family methyltransferase
MEEGLGALVKAKVSRRVTEGVPLEAVQGCLISNELLDAFPVHRVAMKDGELNEFFVTLEEGRYRDVLMELSTPALEERLVSLDVTLREGQQAEISLALGPWLEEAARALQRGYIVTVDYGRQAKDLYSEERLRGTLTSFYRHVQTDNPYQHVGEQDITAQVDFTTPVELGRSLGLRPVALSPQGVFLDNLGIRSFITRLAALGLDQKTRDANRMGMINLIRPGGLGDFKVLVQAKGAPTAGLWGVDRGEEVRWLVEKAPVPLLTGLHMPLLQGRYPHLA